MTEIRIDERRLVDLAIRLVSVPSFTGSAEAAARVMCEVLDELGLQTQWQQVGDRRRAHADVQRAHGHLVLGEGALAAGNPRLSAGRLRARRPDLRARHLE